MCLIVERRRMILPSRAPQLPTQVIVFIALITLATGARAAQPAPLPSATLSIEKRGEYSDLAVKWEKEYLQIDTTNPPGNELRAAVWYKKILDTEGIENRIFEYSPGRANLWARLPHTTTNPKRPIILLNHMDVVTSDAAHWRVPPFSAQVVEGAVYGRGAQDMKSEGLAQLVVMVMLKREKITLDRDVIFLAVSDEEAAGSGTDWMIANQKDLLGNAEFLINEGGDNLLENGTVRYVGVDVGEKSPFWLHLVARGRPGHGSRPITDSAPNRLVRALNRVLQFETPIYVTPVVEEYFRQMAVYEPADRAEKFRNLKTALEDKRFRDELTHDEGSNFLLRTTISLTMLGGSKQTNVIPPEAWANLDVRMLPGQDPKAFLADIRRVINDDNITVEPESDEFRLPNQSSIDNDLYAAIRKVNGVYFPSTPVVPKITSGYTENQRYRPLGITCYGYTGFTATEDEGDSEHGNNERIRLEEVRRGPRILFDVVATVAGK
jgi:acetylornithine deacetylase/succinyl-diaminopimelate desuccinylase-like protein